MNDHERKPWVLAETSEVRVYRCGQCGDTHVEVGTVCMRMSTEGLRGFARCLRCLAHQTPLITNAVMRRRPWAFTFEGMPYQVLLDHHELEQLIQAVEGALRVIERLHIEQQHQHHQQHLN